MTIEAVKNTILKLESLCESFETPSHMKLDDLEEMVVHLSHEVERLDLASDQSLKKELSVLECALEKLSSALKKQQKNIESHVNKLDLQQRALYAYARVANNNLGSVVQYS